MNAPRAKLLMPPVRRGLVVRHRLFALLSRGAQSTVTLLSAEPGFGKTTVLVDWLRSDGRPHAWLTLDEGDNDMGCLAANLVAAIRLGVPALESTLPSLEEAVSREPRLLLIELLDALRNLAHDLVLVLDDCQALTASGVWEIVSSLIDYAPQQLRLVLATRVVPPLPLHRLRARGQLTELGAADLRFEPEEATVFLRQTLGLDLGAESERELSDITEGWPVGLQLAGLAARGKSDPGTIVSRFTGSHRYLLEFLTREVLQNLDEPTRNLLLSTSILRELSVPVVAAVTQCKDGHDVASALRRLDQANLFVIGLDETNERYRYHRLFASLLEHQLELTHAKSEVAVLHMLASSALEQQGELAEALHHSFCAESWDRAERLFMLQADLQMLRGLEQWIDRQIDRFPQRELSRRPALLIKRAWCRVNQPGPEGVDSAIAAAHHALRAHPDTGAAAELHILSCHQALEKGDLPLAAEHLERCDRDISSDRPLLWSILAEKKVHLCLMDDRLDEARAIADAALSSADSSGLPSLIGGWILLQLEMLQGNLTRGLGLLEHLEKSGDRALGAHEQLGGLVVLRAAAFAERGDLDEAAEELERAQELLDPEREPRFSGLHSLVAMRVEALRAPDARGWLDAFSRGRTIATTAGLGDLAQRLDCLRVRLELATRAEGHEARAKDWLTGMTAMQAEQTVGVPSLAFRTDQMRLTVGRAQIACGDITRAMRIANTLIDRAERSGRIVCAVEAHLLLADVALHQGDERTRAQAIHQAIRLAAPEGIVAPFLEHSEELLGEVRRSSESLRRSLDQHSRTVLVIASAAEEPSAPKETLSSRELEVLELVAQGLSNAEVGRQLFVAPSTVKKHLEHIYEKLGVRRRTQAVARARDLRIVQ